MRVVGATMLAVVGLTALYFGTRNWGDLGAVWTVAGGIFLIVLAAAVMRRSVVAMILGAILGILLVVLGALAMLFGAVILIDVMTEGPGPHGVGPIAVVIWGGGGIIAFAIGLAVSVPLILATRATRSGRRPLD